MQIIRRQRAAQEVFQRFHDSVFAYGTNDCAILAAASVIALGYPNPLRNVGTYGTARNAYKAMRKAGFKNVEDCLDQLGFKRIAPAAALPGDILGFRGVPRADGSDSGLALGVSIGQAKALAFIDVAGLQTCCFGPADEAVTAWCVPPAPVEGVS